MRNKPLVKSLYFQPEMTLGMFKNNLLKHLSVLEMPKGTEEHGHECNRNCHMMERNHTIETIRQYVEGKEEPVDNLVDAGDARR